MEGHARLGPSNHRWPKCPGSVREEARYPDIPGEAAIDGTGSHLLLETCLMSGFRAETYIGQVIGVGHEDMPMGWVIHTDRVERVQMCLDYVSRRRRELQQEFPESIVSVYAESKSNPGVHCIPARDDWWGTTDITITVSTIQGALQFLEVADYKDGRGWVKEEDNTQLLSYLIGKAKGGLIVSDGVRFRVTIVQPKSSKPVRYVDGMTMVDVESWLAALSVAAAATDHPEAPLVAGDHCGWCKANPKRGGHCAQPVTQSIEEVLILTDNTMPSVEGGALQGLFALDVASAAPEDLARIMDQEPAIQAAFDRVRKEIEARVGQGLPVPGWGLVPGKAARTWASDEEAIKVLKSARLKIDEYTPRSLVSPAQAERLVGKEVFKKKIEAAVVTTTGPSKIGRVAVAKEETPAADMFAGVPEQQAIAVPSFPDEAPALSFL